MTFLKIISFDMTIFLLTSSLSLTIWEKLFAYLFNKSANDYVISKVISYLSQHADHFLIVGNY